MQKEKLTQNEKTVGMREKKWMEKKDKIFETARIAQLIKVGIFQQNHSHIIMILAY